jgi:signal transduction histidine kinase
MADGEQLKQVFMNLVSNAVEAMEQQGRGSLTITTKQRDNNVQVTFADTGPGISEEHVTRLFDPFFSTKTKGKGVGLGLSVAYGIIQQHCGTIFLDSKEDQGTSIVIRLPLKQPKHKYE